MSFNLQRYIVAQLNKQNEELDIEPNIPEMGLPEEIEETPIDDQANIENPESIAPVIPEEQLEQELTNDDTPQEIDQATSDTLTQGAMNISGVFSQLMTQYNLDKLGDVIEPQKAQAMIDRIVDKTLANIKQKLGV